MFTEFCQIMLNKCGNKFTLFCVGCTVTKDIPCLELKYHYEYIFFLFYRFHFESNAGIGLFVEMNVSSKSSCLRRQMLTKV